MTYIVGWKDQFGNAYLCVDSVATTSDRSTDELSGELTSFGERHVDTPKKQVSESALKIVHLGCIAVAIAGDAQTAFSMVERIADLTRAGVPPKKAFADAVTSHCPLPRDRPVQLLAVIPEEPAAALLAFNVQSKEELIETKRGGYAHIGCIGRYYKELSAAVMNTIILGARLSARRTLASTLGILQSMGVREYLLEEHHAGGSFSGMFATPEGIYWQPDILYAVFTSMDLARVPPQYVLSKVRDHALILDSTFSRTRRIFGNSINGACSEEWKAKWMEEVSKPWPLQSYDYVVLLNSQWANISVIELLGNLESKFARLKVWPAREAEGPGLELILSDRVNRDVVFPMPRDAQHERNGGVPVRFGFFEYLP